MDDTTAYLVDLLSDTPNIQAQFLSKELFLYWVSVAKTEQGFAQRIQHLVDENAHDVARTRRLKIQKSI